MPRSLALLTVPALLAAVAAAAPAPKVAKGALYFPTTVGAKWVYQQGEWEGTYVVAAVERKDGVYYVTVDEVGEDGKRTPFEQKLVSERALSMVEHYKLGLKPDTPFHELELTLRPGQKWNVGKGGLTHTMREAEWVKVPAGRYRAIPVDRTDATPPGGPPQTDWYAPDVGLVKRVSPRVKEPYVLKSFTPGPK